MHAGLDKKISGLENTGRFTDEQIHDLKKQRLNLKDQITDLKRRQWEHDNEFIENDNE